MTHANVIYMYIVRLWENTQHVHEPVVKNVSFLQPVLNNQLQILDNLSHT